MTLVHPRWDGCDLERLGVDLQKRLSSSPLRLLHAWGSVLWTDSFTVCKLTRPRSGVPARGSLRAVGELLRVDPLFPTLAPLSFDALPVRLGESGEWLLTRWPYRSLAPVPQPPADVHYYRELGVILRRLHEVRVPGLTRHDPLEWARSRVTELALVGDVSTLRAQVAALAARHTAAYPSDCDVTVHGDVHWGQVALDETGRMLLLDLDTLAVGHPSVDCVPSAGWLRRTGAPPTDHLDALREGYGEPWPLLSPEQVAVSTDIAVFSQLTWRLLYGGRRQRST